MNTLKNVMDAINMSTCCLNSHFISRSVLDELKYYYNDKTHILNYVDNIVIISINVNHISRNKVNILNEFIKSKHMWITEVYD